MKINQVIDRLDFVRQSGKDNWIARCPAHQDSSPSLSIKELSDGRILIHCHAGCGALDVLQSIGLDYDVLFPDDDNYQSVRGKASRETVDSLVIEIAEHDRARGQRLSRADVERYKAALKRKPPKSDAVVEVLYESGALTL